MNSKHFNIVITKGIEGGKIIVGMDALYFSDPKLVTERYSTRSKTAFIFNSLSRVRDQLIWDEGLENEGYSSISRRSFWTGAEAGKWIEEVRQQLIELDHRVEHLENEIKALPE